MIEKFKSVYPHINLRGRTLRLCGEDPNTPSNYRVFTCKAVPWLKYVKDASQFLYLYPVDWIISAEDVKLHICGRAMSLGTALELMQLEDAWERSSQIYQTAVEDYCDIDLPLYRIQDVLTGFAYVYEEEEMKTCGKKIQS